MASCTHTYSDIIWYGIYESSEYAAAMVNPVTIKSSLHSYQTTLSRVIAAIYTL